MKIAGLDFETANCMSGSICAAGCAVFEDDVMTYKNEWLVKPHKTLDFVSSFCYRVHEISWYDLRQAPEFPEVWSTLQGMLTCADAVVIHNSVLGLNRLKSALKLYNLPCVRFNVVDSLAVSREKFPDLKSHSLDCVSAHLGCKFKYHDALEDAIACAKIIIHTGIPEKFKKRFEYRQA